MQRLAAITAAALLAVGVAQVHAKPQERPKLRVTKLSSPPATARVGESFAVRGKVANRGDRRGKARVKLFLGETKVGAEKRKVRPGKRRRFAAEVEVPQMPGAGAYEEGLPLRACVRKRGSTGKRRCRTAEGLLKISAGSGTTPNPVAGARTLNDPVFPQIGNGGYDVGHYDLVLNYDPAANTFGAGTKTTIDAVATQNLREFSLDFQDLNVSAVLVNGTAATFTQGVATSPLVGKAGVTPTQLTKLVVTPQSTLPRGQAFRVEVRYSGEPQQMTDADGSPEGWIRACSSSTSCDGAFVVNEPNGAQTFMPSNNHPRDKATIDTHTTVPSTHVAFGVGELVGGTPVDNGNGTRTWNWTEDDPTATYLTTATVGLFEYTTPNMTETSTSRTLPIHRAYDSSANSGQAAAVNGSFSLIPTQMNQLSGWYGPYPFDSTGGIADRTTGVGYALEVQTKPHYATLTVDPSTQVHELAHQWFGNSVSPANWRELWFNEGWARFSEWYSNGPGHAQIQFSGYYNNPATSWSLAPRAIDPITLFNVNAVYDRPAAAIEGYREILNDDTKFLSFAKGLITEYGYGLIDYPQFVEETVAASGFTGAEADKLRQYWDQWLNGTTKPSLDPSDF